MKNLFLKSPSGILLSVFLNLIFVAQCGFNAAAEADNKKSVKLAILLDTSNSMDGLIEQAKAQLWNIVNELALAKCDGVKPELKIALYEYGNNHLSPAEGYIRMVTPLTSDLDQISEDLFSLTTNGGEEFCGHAIQSALRQLDWSKSSGDYQTIFIAGNEPFTQGAVDFRESCAEAARKGVVVNTIFCGPFEEGVRTSWKQGAQLTGGQYFSIEQDRKTVFIPSPYDDRIVDLNRQLNDTYIFYGSSGREKKEMQARQDRNAASYGQANVVNRAVSKSSHAYKNESWDLVDASEEAGFSVAEVNEESLPDEMKTMSEQEKLSYINAKREERRRIQKLIAELNKKRAEFLAEKEKDSGGSEMLGSAIVNAVRDQAKTFDFEFK